LVVVVVVVVDEPGTGAGTSTAGAPGVTVVVVRSVIVALWRPLSSSTQAATAPAIPRRPTTIMRRYPDLVSLMA
jgi:hypothetical protein